MRVLEIETPSPERFLELAEKLKGIRYKVSVALKKTADWTPWVNVYGTGMSGREVPCISLDKIDKRIFEKAGREQLCSEALQCAAEEVNKIVESPAGQALDWIERQHSYKLAFRRVGFKMLDNETLLAIHTDRLTRSIEYIATKGPGWTFATDLVLSRHVTTYHSWLGGVCEAIHGYTSGEQLRIATHGQESLLRAQRLLQELMSILDEPVFKNLAGRHWLERLESRIDIAAFKQQKHRKDDFLPERLMAASLLRNNYAIFKRPELGAVNDLMGLPFVENLIEPTTIKRVWRSCKPKSQKVQKSPEKA